MPKPAVTTRQSLITLDPASGVALHRQIYDRVRQAILSGQLRPGQRLPASRTLASQLAISRNTVSTAYDQLMAEGYLDSKVGYGTVVARALPELLLTVPTPARSNTNHPPVKSAGPELSRIGLQITARQPELPQHVTHSAVPTRATSFRVGQPDLVLFPFKLWAQLVARRARQGLPDKAGYQHPAGYRPLREAIAAHLGVARGVRCQPEQVIIVSGSQSGLDLTARLLLDPGDLAWIENPGYFGARYALQNAGVRLAPVPVTAEGLDVAVGKTRYPQARLAFVTPSHQFPLGLTMSLRQRLALLEWATQSNAWIIEDDYDSDYRFSGRPLEALQGLDRANRVIYIGTFSKVLFPALRLGYLVVPPALVEPFLAFRRFVDTHLPILEQMALADFITEGHFIRHIRRMRTVYAARRATLLTAAKNELGELLEISPSQAGIHLLGWLPAGITDTYVSREAARQSVEVLPVSKLSLEPLPRGGLVLGYGAVSEPEIVEGIRKLSRIIREINTTKPAELERNLLLPE
jgi:GntR family transcriptional regulator/MocR family aminotransferase